MADHDLVLDADRRDGAAGDGHVGALVLDRHPLAASLQRVAPKGDHDAHPVTHFGRSLSPSGGSVHSVSRGRCVPADARAQLGVRRVGHLFERETLAPERRSRRDPGPGSQQRPGHSGGRRPSPTGSSAPTSERTIEWQNASARTVATDEPVCGRAPTTGRAGCGRCSLPPGADRTRRSRAPPAAAGPPRSAGRRRAVAVVEHLVPAQRVHRRQRISAPGRRTGATRHRTARRTRRGADHGPHHHVGGQHARAASGPDPPARPLPGPRRDVDVRDLAAGVDAGVRAARHRGTRPLRPGAALEARAASSTA